MPGVLPVGPVPRPVRYAAWVVLLGAITMMICGAVRIGVTWDESYHVQRFNNYLDTGWYVIDAQRVGDGPGRHVTDQYVYGPATMLLLHGLGVIAGVERPGAAATTADAYMVRHLGISLISIIGLLAMAGTARLLLRRWDWALVAAAILSVLPMWLGHSMFNLKDVPVATGYALLTFGLAIVAREQRGHSKMLAVAGAGPVAAGTLLAVGTRPGMWTAVAASIGTLVLCQLLSNREIPARIRVRRDLWRLRDVVVGLVIAGAGLWALDPRVFGSPARALWKAAFSSANFLGIESPWYFVPGRVFLQTPFLMLGLLCVGTFVCVRAVLATRLHPGAFETRLMLVLVQVFTLPLIAMVHHASLYGDLRQLLFAAPGSVLLTTVGVAYLVSRARSAKDPRGRGIVAVVTCAAIVAPLLDQATLFPYNYAYYNFLTTVGRIPVVGEYYRGSGRELASDIPADGRIVCTPVIDEKMRALRTAHLDGNVDCRTAVASPIAAFRDRLLGSQPPLRADQFWAVSFAPAGTVPENCSAVAGVTRRIGIRRTHMATLSRCTMPFPVLSGRSISFDRVSDLAYLDLGWYLPDFDPDRKGVRSMGGPSTLTFRLSRDFVGQAVDIDVSTTASVRAASTFGGLPVRVQNLRGGESGVRISIPRALVERAVSTPLTLAFRSTNAEILDMTLLSLRAERSDAG